MIIVVEGITVETRDIWDITDLSSSRKAGFVIKLIDKNSISITEDISHDAFSHQRQDAHSRYDRLRKQIEAKWNEDKTDLLIFKL